jgi:hypothetical protein
MCSLPTVYITESYSIKRDHPYRFQVKPQLEVTTPRQILLSFRKIIKTYSWHLLNPFPWVQNKTKINEEVMQQTRGEVSISI